MKSLNEERFSQEEVAEILRLANSDIASTGTLSRAELLAAAEEAGLSQARVEQAIQKAKSTQATTALSPRRIVKEFDFAVNPSDIPTILGQLPPGADRMVKMKKGFFSTWFDQGITRYHILVLTDSSTTRLEVRIDRSSQYVVTAVIFLLGLVGFAIASVPASVVEFLAFAVILGLIAQLPALLNKRKPKERMLDIASRLETHLRNLAGR